MAIRAVAATLLLLGGCASTAIAQSTGTAGEVRIAIGGGFQSSQSPFTRGLAFPRDLETAIIDTTYEINDGPTIDVAASVGLGRGFAVQGGASIFREPGSATLRGSIPHPFFFSQPRLTELPIPSLTHRESAERLELAWSFPIVPRVQIGISGGLAAIQVRHALVESVSVADAFPFETVTLSPVTRDARGWGFGGTAALDVEWRAARRVGLGVTGRYLSASVDMADTIVDAGGGSAVASVRVRLR